MQGRPRKPTAILEMSGAFKKDPQRRDARAAEPIPQGPIGEPPEHLNDIEKAAWGAFIEETPPGVLTIADRALLTQASKLRAALDLGTFQTESGRLNAEKLFLSMLTRIGATPADRSRIHAAAPGNVVEAADEFKAI